MGPPLWIIPRFVILLVFLCLPTTPTTAVDKGGRTVGVGRLRHTQQETTAPFPDAAAAVSVCRDGVDKYYYKYTFVGGCTLEGYSAGDSLLATWCVGDNSTSATTIKLDLSCTSKYQNGYTTNKTFGPLQGFQPPILEYCIQMLQDNTCDSTSYCAYGNPHQVPKNTGNDTVIPNGGIISQSTSAVILAEGERDSLSMTGIWHQIVLPGEEISSTAYSTSSMSAADRLFVATFHQNGTTSTSSTTLVSIGSSQTSTSTETYTSISVGSNHKKQSEAPASVSPSSLVSITGQPIVSSMPMTAPTGPSTDPSDAIGRSYHPSWITPSMIVKTSSGPTQLPTPYYDDFNFPTNPPTREISASLPRGIFSQTSYYYHPRDSATAPTNALPTGSNQKSATPTFYVADYDKHPSKPSTSSTNNVVAIPDFAFIDGCVFNDTNANGKQDNDEVGILGCMMLLFDASSPSNPVCKNETDSSGFYIFNWLPLNKDYTVEVDLSSFHHSDNVVITSGISYAIHLTKTIEHIDVGITDGKTVSSGLI